MGIAAAERLAPVAVLAELAVCDRAEKAASARRLELAVIWAGLHPGIALQPYDKVVDSLIDEATGVAVAAIAEFAAVHGVSTNAGGNWSATRSPCTTGCRAAGSGWSSWSCRRGRRGCSRSMPIGSVTRRSAGSILTPHNWATS